MSSLKLSDDRSIEYIDNGVPSKSALILHHGTPLMATPDEALATATSNPFFGDVGSE